MNIEEERKAFEESEAYGFCRHSAFEEDYFKVWLAAKKHAEEMVKPTVKIKRATSVCTRYPWVVSLFEGETFNGVLEDFAAKEDAEAWAHNCGYRVIK